MHPALIDWALPLSGALGLWLTASSGRYFGPRLVRTLGYALGLAGQPIWLIWTYQQMPEVYGPFATSVLFTAAWARGLWRARRG